MRWGSKKCVFKRKRKKNGSVYILPMGATGQCILHADAIRKIKILFYLLAKLKEQEHLGKLNGYISINNRMLS